jgi:hypothetical protein
VLLQLRRWCHTADHAKVHMRRWGQEQLTNSGTLASSMKRAMRDPMLRVVASPMQHWFSGGETVQYRTSYHGHPTLQMNVPIVYATGVCTMKFMQQKLLLQYSAPQKTPGGAESMRMLHVVRKGKLGNAYEWC